MVTRVVMPRLSLTMKEGTVGRWYKKEGEAIEKNEPIVEIISEKATYDLEAPTSGVLRKILVQEGVDAAINETLALIADPNEPVSEAELSVTPPQMEEGETRILASPAAKRLARERGIDLSRVKGSGPGGRISEDDVEQFQTGQASISSPTVRQAVPLSGLRKITAERLSMSFRTAPHSSVSVDVDTFNAAMVRQKARISYTSILVKAVAEALQEHLIVNSTLDGETIKSYVESNVGVAVATDNGLLVPVVKNADEKSLPEIETSIRDMSEKARAGRLSKEELSGGTFTVTNLGMFGVDFFVPIINPPEAAILGVGAIKEKPVVEGGKIVVKPMMMLTMSYDHRIIDGAPAANFLRAVKDKIERITV